MYDLVQWFLMPSIRMGYKLPSGAIYGREADHLEGMNLTNNTKVSAYHNDTGKTMIFTKSKQGFPADRKAYDNQFIYDTGTELNWKNPKDFKQMNPQMAMCTRFWNGDESLYQFHQHAAYDTYQNCAITGHGDVGPAYFTLKGPFSMDFLGNVGACNTILLTYYWTDMKNREQLFLTDRAGWVNWTHAVLTQISANLSQYVIDASVTHNMIVPGVVTPQFPCSVIP